MNKNELIDNPTVLKYDSKFNAKFDFLYSKVMKSHIKEISYFSLVEKTILKNFAKLISNLNKKAEDVCEKNIEKIKLYSPEFKEDFKQLSEYTKIENIKNLKIIPGNEREFNLAFDDLIKCSNKIFGVAQEIKNKFQYMSDLTKNTNEFCLEECKGSIVELRQTEKEATDCIESCWRYKKLNLEACIEITENEIREKEKMIGNL